MNAKISILLALLAVLQFASLVDGHARLLEPKARNGGFIGAFDNFVSPACGGDGSKNNARPQDATYRRGQSVPVVWPRNNHPGGFIKLAIVPLNSAQTQADFDNNVVQFACHESGCKSGFASDPLGGDNAPEDSNRCTTQLKIPAFLADGQYTLQWHWFGGASFFGDKNRGQTDYYGCHDFTVAGGDAFNAGSKPRCPTFIAGDAHNPASSGRCKFFGTGSPLSCRPDGCQGTYKDGIPKPLEQCLAANGGGNNLAPAPQPNPAPAPAPAPPAPRPNPPAPQPSPQCPANNLQPSTARMFGIQAPALQMAGGKFRVAGNAGGEFLNLVAALMRSCDVQNELCAARIRSGRDVQGRTVQDCNNQSQRCKALVR
ncbi:hypothetical protein BCR44DRAFT_115559 [Catenaria anguillulae PL171]|uniref:Chitin-binding type-4 domain-containing protein n=1 Tax=Catenaria anguillulae PL171 TaxID=765915 RepID=A0A1Y2HWZ4_9FUNG|nr:hypothetical protein BCR44DRAFT_115559 [Catenaria anguillulae PL171]